MLPADMDPFEYEELGGGLMTPLGGSGWFGISHLRFLRISWCHSRY